MARKPRQRHLGTASYEGAPAAFAPSDEDWGRIGGDYCKLTADDRREISKAVRSYLKFRLFESVAPPVNDVAKRLDEISGTAQRLYGLLESCTDTGSAALDQLVERLRFKYPDQDILLEPGILAAQIMISATHAKKTIESSGPGIEAHDAWERLARDVMDWAEGRGLPVTIAQKTPTSKNWPSPFVKFFSRLQDAMPEEAREFCGQETSLTNALSNVRLAK